MNRKAFYFSHDYDARNDPKLVALRMKMGLEAIGAYWGIVEMLYSEGGYLQHSQLEVVAFSIGAKVEDLKKIIATSLFESNDTTFWSNSILERLAEKDEKAGIGRASATKRWKPPTELEFAEYRKEVGKEFPGVDIEEQYKKFKLFWETRTLKNPKLAWRNWITKEDAIQKGKPAPVELKNW